MNDSLKIYVDRLRDGEKDTINESFSPDFIDLKEEGLKFSLPVKVEGEFYLAEKELVIHLDIHTNVLLPCIVCNQDVLVEIEIKNAYQAIPLSEIKGAIFDLKEVVRELILLDAPSFAECNQGACSERITLDSYLKDKKDANASENPFANLSIDDLNLNK